MTEHIEDELNAKIQETASSIANLRRRGNRQGNLPERDRCAQAGVAFIVANDEPGETDYEAIRDSLSVQTLAAATGMTDSYLATLVLIQRKGATSPPSSMLE